MQAALLAPDPRSVSPVEMAMERERYSIHLYPHRYSHELPLNPHELLNISICWLSPATCSQDEEHSSHDSESGGESEDSDESSEGSDMDVMEEACERGRAPWTQEGEIFQWCFFPIDRGW